MKRPHRIVNREVEISGEVGWSVKEDTNGGVTVDILSHIHQYSPSYI